MTNINNPIKFWLYSFHMPLFFVLSGYCSTFSLQRQFREYLKRKIKTIFIPTVCFTILISLWLYFGEKIPIVSYLSEHLPHALWFLEILFICDIINYFLIKLPKWIYAIIMIACLIAGVYLHHLRISFPHTLASSPISMFFIGMGSLLSPVWRYTLQLKFQPKDLLLCISALFSAFFFGYIFVGSSFFYDTTPYALDISANNIKCSNAINSLLCIGGLCGICSMIAHWNKKLDAFMGWLGRNTLAVMCIHLLFIRCFGHYLRPLSPSHAIYKIIEFPLVIVCSLVFARLAEKHFPFIIGKK